MKKDSPTYQLSNKFEVLARRVMNVGIPSEREAKKDRKTILKKERLKEEKKKKKEKLVEVWKAKKERLLREITVKIGLEKINIQKGITVETLLDNRVMVLGMSSEVVR